MKRLGPKLKMPARLKGPRLKGSLLKAPAFMADLYYDLRDRRLLPLVALVVVAIAAVPFLLGDAEEVLPPPVTAGAGSVVAEATEASTLTVVEAKPGLRDYRKRLRRRTPTDPFEQRHTGSVLKGAKLKSTSKTSSSSSSSSSTKTKTSTSVTVTETETTESGKTGGAPSRGGGAKPGSGGGDDPSLTLFTFAIDVQISRSEGEGEKRKMGKPTTKRRVLPATPLPGEKAPVVTYMGMNTKTRKALLLVSNNVVSIFGDAKCVSGTDICQLLEAETGFPVTFVYGPGEVRYSIKVIKIEPVVTGRT